MTRYCQGFPRRPRARLRTGNGTISGSAFAIAFAVLCFVGTSTAFAHPGHSSPPGHPWAAGALHPLLGIDHLLAVLASGLLAVRIGTRRALWLVPLSFVGVMLCGGFLAAVGVPLLPAEWGVALSVIVLGLIVAALPRVPLSAGVGLAALFAVCHGHAHVMEASSRALLPYMAGFTIVTLALHAAAIGAGLAARWSARPQLIRLAGASIAAGFALMLCVG